MRRAHPPSILVRLVAIIALAAFGVIGPAPARAAATDPVVLVSIDGFRWDYLDRYAAETPNLRQLRAEGVSAEGLIPAFPSNTFPAHYTIVTGQRPTRNGMLNNTMFDAASGLAFIYNRPGYAQDPQWWGGEPIWITAVKQGRVSATSFWPGSEAPIDGLHPTYWKPFNYRIPFATRLEEVAGWLDRPAAERPALVTFYLEETNSVGHRYGPSSPELRAAVQQMDIAFGAMRARLERDGRRINWVVVSDHGMIEVDLQRLIVLDHYVDAATVQVDFDGTIAGLRPAPGQEAALLAALARIPPEQGRAYAAADLPAHLHIDPRSPRVPPVWILPAEGWRVFRQTSIDRAPSLPPTLGDHGYDPTLRSMNGILLAAGPVFRAGGAMIPRVESVHVYALLCAALGLTPAPHDGDDRLAQAMLAAPP